MFPNIVRLNIQLTKKCNQRCRSCNSYELDCSDEISLEDFQKAIKEAASLFDLKNIAFTGGEPTLYPSFTDIAAYARKFSEKVSITTNGYYCTSRERVQKLIDSGVNRFSFSYHGVGIHDNFTRVPGCENRLRKAIDFIVEERKNDPDLYIKVGTLYTGNNLNVGGGVSEILSYVESKGIDLYIELLDNKIPTFSQSELANKNKINELQLKNDLLEIKKWLNKGKRIIHNERSIEFIKRWFLNEQIKGECPLWNTDLYVESNGNIRSGCWSLPSIGNIREKSIDDMLKSEKFKNNVEIMKKRKCNGCTCGYLMQAKYMD